MPLTMYRKVCILIFFLRQGLSPKFPQAPHRQSSCEPQLYSLHATVTDMGDYDQFLVLEMKLGTACVASSPLPAEPHIPPSTTALPSAFTVTGSG